MVLKIDPVFPNQNVLLDSYSDAFRYQLFLILGRWEKGGRLSGSGISMLPQLI